jgi:hypothetical protein
MTVTLIKGPSHTYYIDNHSQANRDTYCKKLMRAYQSDIDKERSVIDNINISDKFLNLVMKDKRLRFESSHSQCQDELLAFQKSKKRDKRAR